MHKDDSQWVFTTEGHILSLEPHQLKPISAARRKLRRVENLQCPEYLGPLLAYDGWDADTGMNGGILSRADTDYVRQLVGRAASEYEVKTWTPDGWCQIPRFEPYVSCTLLCMYTSPDAHRSRKTYDFILSADGSAVPEDPLPSSDKLITVADGFLVHDMSGIRVQITSRLDGKGYDIMTRERIFLGQLVVYAKP